MNMKLYMMAYDVLILSRLLRGFSFHNHHQVAVISFLKPHSTKTLSRLRKKTDLKDIKLQYMSTKEAQYPHCASQIEDL